MSLESLGPSTVAQPARDVRLFFIHAGTDSEGNKEALFGIYYDP